MIQIKEIGPIDSLKLLRQVKLNNLSALVDIANNNVLTCLKLGNRKTFIPSSVELLINFFGLDQKVLIKTPKAQYYTSKAIGVGLITTDKDAWVDKRKQVRGIFSSQQISNLMKGVEDSIHHRLTQLSGEINLSDLFNSISIDIIGHIFFDAFSNEDGEKIKESVNQMVEPTFKRIISPLPFFVDPFNKLTAKARNGLFKILEKNIEKARVSKNDNLTKQYYPAGKCTEDISNIFVAGYETTSNTMTWLFYEIEKNKEVKKRLSGELNSVFNFENYQQLLLQIPFTIACVHEILRLYPPVWILGRTSTEKFSIENLEVPVNTDIVLSPYVFHRLDRYWDNPNQYDPSRFFNAEISVSDRKYYFPFGIGTRGCIGEKLAMMEMYLVLLTVFQGYNFTVESKVVTPKAHFTLRPTEIISINLKRKIGHH